MNNIKAIFIKQLTTHLKVPSLLGMGILFLILGAAMIIFLSPPEIPDCDVCIPAYVCDPCEVREAERFQLPVPSGLGMFAALIVGLMLMITTQSLVSEDKSTTNLRFMAMADVKPYQYMLATTAATIIIVAGLVVFYALVDRHFVGTSVLRYIALCVSGGLVSILLGITIGLSKVPVLALPSFLILGFGPTLSAQNEILANVLRFTFTQQVTVGLADLEADLSQNLLIIAANGAVVLLLFFIIHRKNKFVL